MKKYRSLGQSKVDSRFFFGVSSSFFGGNMILGNNPCYSFGVGVKTQIAIERVCEIISGGRSEKKTKKAIINGEMSVGC